MIDHGRILTVQGIDGHLRIISGGQTGVDIAALDFALENGIPIGGWVPNGRSNESGKVPERFVGLSETPETDVSARTERNIETSDATLVFVDGSKSPGTDLTISYAQKCGKPILVVDTRNGVDANAEKLRAWLQSVPIEVLNVGGPRQSEAPDLSAKVKHILKLSIEPSIPSS